MKNRNKLQYTIFSSGENQAWGTCLTTQSDCLFHVNIKRLMRFPFWVSWGEQNMIDPLWLLKTKVWIFTPTNFMSGVSRRIPHATCYLKAHNHSLVIAQVSVSSWHILVNYSYGFPQLRLVKCDPLKQYLVTGRKCRHKYIWHLFFALEIMHRLWTHVSNLLTASFS